MGILSGATGKSPGRLPWTLERYANELDRIVHWLARLHNASGIPVAFMATTANPLHAGGRQVTCPPGYTEYPHIVRAFNQIAEHLTRRHGLEYLDTFAITRDIFELTFDGGHYGDPASRALAQAVERWLEGVLS